MQRPRDFIKDTQRSYRRMVRGRLKPVRVIVQETDLSVYADGLTPDDIKEAVIVQRGYLENYIQRFPGFAQTLAPWRNMWGAICFTGPMKSSSKTEAISLLNPDIPRLWGSLPAIRH